MRASPLPQPWRSPDGGRRRLGLLSRRCLRCGGHLIRGRGRRPKLQRRRPREAGTGSGSDRPGFSSSRRCRPSRHHSGHVAYAWYRRKRCRPSPRKDSRSAHDHPSRSHSKRRRHPPRRSHSAIADQPTQRRAAVAWCEPDLKELSRRNGSGPRRRCARAPGSIVSALAKPHLHWADRVSCPTGAAHRGLRRSTSPGGTRMASATWAKCCS